MEGKEIGLPFLTIFFAASRTQKPLSGRLGHVDFPERASNFFMLTFPLGI